MSPGFFEENAPSEISSRMTADTAQIEQVVGHDDLDGAAQCADGRRRNRLPAGSSPRR
jgi:hypothetical protein